MELQRQLRRSTRSILGMAAVVLLHLLFAFTSNSQEKPQVKLPPDGTKLSSAQKAKVPVPDLRGRTPGDAGAALENSGLTVGNGKLFGGAGTWEPEHWLNCMESHRDCSRRRLTMISASPGRFQN
jgi:hypothetical protein